MLARSASSALPASMDLTRHARLIWRHKLAVLAFTILVAAGVFGLMATRPKVYQATAELQVVPGESPGQPPAGQSTEVFLATSFAHLATTPSVLSQAAASSGLGIDERSAARRLSARPSKSVGFLTLDATGPSPSSAKALDTAAVSALEAAVRSEQEAALKSDLKPISTQVSALEASLRALPATSSQARLDRTQLDALLQQEASRELVPLTRLDLVAAPQSSSGPVSPKPVTDAALAFAVALVLGSESAVAYETLGDRFDTEALDEDVRRVTGLPVLARVVEGSRPETIDSFRSLRTSLLFMETPDVVHSVAVVGTDPEVGKSFLAINMAVALAELQMPVLLVDADLRRPVLHERLKQPREPGLGDVLTKGTSLDSAARAVADASTMRFLAAGAAVSDPAGAISEGFAEAVLDHLRPGEVCIVDTTAEGLFPDAAAVASQTDATILVIDPKTARRRQVNRALARLGQVHASVIGIVLNRAKPQDSARYYAYYASPHPKGASERPGGLGAQALRAIGKTPEQANR
jgi:capsular exopolysaccharide synthesis family protein